jgi:hypothetical protein
MQRPMNAHSAELHGFGGSGNISLNHKHHKYRQFAEGYLLINVVFHRLRPAFPLFLVNSSQYNHILRRKF